jgi:disulfide bond formation protein DsbB
MRKPTSSKSSTPSAARPHLPDPATEGPYRSFTTDPHWNEAWWWLGQPVLDQLSLIADFRIEPRWYADWVIPEGYGVLEFSQLAIMLLALALAVGLLLKPFVRQRPFVLTVTIIAALSCLYIAGEEMSWGQHFFHWNTPEYWAAVNRQEETNLHNTYAIFDKWPRAILELGVLIGGIPIPVAAAFVPRVRASRLSLFFPAAAQIPTAIIALGIKAADMLSQKGYVGELFQRPSEAIELYLYYFILTYLIVFARRIREIEGA